MDFNRLFPLSSLYFEPLSGRAVDSHVEHRRLGFVALARRHASHLVGLRSSSTVGNYLTALRSFSSFLGGTDVSLGAVTSRLVCGYARWLADRGVMRNTASCYLRSLRTLYRVEMAVIAQALGHANTRTTWTYVRQTGNGVLAAANRKIIREIVLHTSGKEVFSSA